MCLHVRMAALGQHLHISSVIPTGLLGRGEPLTFGNGGIVALGSCIRACQFLIEAASIHISPIRSGGICAPGAVVLYYVGRLGNW